uniref:Uncharacterized protein n=1 Tax=Glossina palpalis gambiensis TaxID=67801 RepID=A0A1B0AX52_9MUSC
MQYPLPFYKLPYTCLVALSVTFENLCTLRLFISLFPFVLLFTSIKILDKTCTIPRAVDFENIKRKKKN